MTERIFSLKTFSENLFCSTVSEERVDAFDIGEMFFLRSRERRDRNALTSGLVRVDRLVTKLSSRSLTFAEFRRWSLRIPAAKFVTMVAWMEYSLSIGGTTKFLPCDYRQNSAEFVFRQSWKWDIYNRWSKGRRVGSGSSRLHEVDRCCFFFYMFHISSKPWTPHLIRKFPRPSPWWRYIRKNVCGTWKNSELYLPLYISPGTWKNTDLFPAYRLWVLEKFRASSSPNTACWQRTEWSEVRGVTPLTVSSFRNTGLKKNGPASCGSLTALLWLSQKASKKGE